jgi:hypothetical protein
MDDISEEELFSEIAVAVATSEHTVIESDERYIHTSDYSLLSLTVTPIPTQREYEDLFQNYCQKINENIATATNAHDLSTLYIENISHGIRRINYTTFSMNNPEAEGILQGVVGEGGIYSIQIVIKKFQEINRDHVFAFVGAHHLKKSENTWLNDLPKEVIKDNIISQIAHVSPLHHITGDPYRMEELLDTMKNIPKIRIDEIFRNDQRALEYDFAGKILRFNVPVTEMPYVESLKSEMSRRRYERTEDLAPESQVFNIEIPDRIHDYISPLKFTIHFPPLSDAVEGFLPIDIHGIGYHIDEDSVIVPEKCVFSGADVLRYFMLKCDLSGTHSRISFIDRVHVEPKSRRQMACQM